MERDYTEFGIKIHKLRLTVKVQRRASSHPRRRHSVETEMSRPTATTAALVVGSSLASSMMSATTTNVNALQPEVAAPVRRRRPRRRPRSSSSSNASAFSSLTDSLRLMDLDSSARSRRPLLAPVTSSASVPGPTSSSSSSSRVDSYCRLATDEFFYARPPPSPAADSALAGLSFVSSADSALAVESNLGDFYDVIEEEPANQEEKLVLHHVKMKSMTALETMPKHTMLTVATNSLENISTRKPPPLPPRCKRTGRPPLPPYPSSLVKNKNNILRASPAINQSINQSIN